MTILPTALPHADPAFRAPMAMHLLSPVHAIMPAP